MLSSAVVRLGTGLYAWPMQTSAKYLIVSMAVLVSAPVGAIGLCEDLSVSYEPSFYSEKTQELLVTGSMEWCVEKDDDEERGQWKFAQLRGTDGKVKRSFLNATEAKAKVEFKTRSSASKVEAWSALDAYRAKNAFVDIKSLQGATQCQVSLQVVGIKKMSDGFPLGAAKLAIVLDGTTLHRQSLGECDASEEAQVVLVPLPKSRSLLVWSALPHCDAGFQEPGKDPECALRHEYELSLLSAKEDKGLAACFASAGNSTAPTRSALAEAKKLIDEMALRMTTYVAALKAVKGDQAKIEALKAKFEKDNLDLKARGEALKPKLSPADLEAVKAYGQEKLKPIITEMIHALMPPSPESAR